MTMLKRQDLPTQNSARNILLIVNGSKKRRNRAYSAVKAVNSEFGQKPNFVTVK